MEFNNVDFNGENVVTINRNLFFFFLFFRIVKIDFKMKLQSSFCLEFFQVLAKHDFCIFHFIYKNRMNKSFPC